MRWKHLLPLVLKMVPRNVLSCQPKAQVKQTKKQTKSLDWLLAASDCSLGDMFAKLTIASRRSSSSSEILWYYTILFYRLVQIPNSYHGSLIKWPSSMWSSQPQFWPLLQWSITHVQASRLLVGRRNVLDFCSKGTSYTSCQDCKFMCKK